MWVNLADNPDTCDRGLADEGASATQSKSVSGHGPRWTVDPRRGSRLWAVEALFVLVLIAAFLGVSGLVLVGARRLLSAMDTEDRA